MEGGHPGPTSKKHFSAINKRLQTLIQSYERAEDNEDEDDDENDKHCNTTTLTIVNDLLTTLDGKCCRVSFSPLRS
ncbi:hypothetical protein ACOMHN_030074 [Nucella lapillus]